MKKIAIALAAALALTGTGCWHAADEAARAQAAQDAKAQELTRTQATWTQAVSKVETVRGSLVRNEWDQAKAELDRVYRGLYGVVTAADLTTDLRTRVTRVFPTLITLQSKVDARDPDAKVTADKLADMLRDTNEYMVTSGWLRGGGAGIGAPRIKERMDEAPKTRGHQQDRPGEDETPPIHDGPPTDNRR